MKVKTFVLFSVILFVININLYAKKFNPDKYTKVPKDVIKLSPEKYKGKRIYFITLYQGYNTAFPRYVEQSGIKSNKYFYLKTWPRNLPVIAKKKTFEKTVLKLKKHSGVIVYGKVKHFSFTPRLTVFPKYYLLLENIENTDEEIKDNDEDNDKQGSSVVPLSKRKKILRRLKPPEDW